MQVYGPLMVEHRVIERVIRALQVQHERLAAGERVDLGTLEECIDFLRVYADRTHHGKEEDILFRWLSNRPLPLEHRAVLEELFEEHDLSRRVLGDLAEAGRLHRDGDASSTAAILSSLETLVELYPRHIEKEDRVFFPVAPAYLRENEVEAVLAEYREFDRLMIHEKYRAVAKDLSARVARPAL
jgi:hemerythrin-like domain-containing protein